MRRLKSIIILFFFLLPTNALALTSLPVPFTSQAPFSNWREPWQNACEETVILMVDGFYRGKNFRDRTVARDEILRIFSIKEAAYGKSLDENAEAMVKLVNDFLPWEARVVVKPTLKELKNEIDAGHPVIIPASGVILDNPHFRSHPNYHTIVLSGYDDEKKEFISQEPGTRFGLDFRYSYDRILDAMHDFLPHGATPSGDKVAIFTSPKLVVSAEVDADGDKLTKAEELALGTNPALKDTDKDGFSDGVEVKSGFSPTVAEKSLQNGSLLKAKAYPEVYLLDKGLKRHIISEAVFDSHGWKPWEIILVSVKFIGTLLEGAAVTK